MNLSYSAIMMLIFGATVLYGGLAYFLYRAFRAMKNK
ncbi:MAG: MetS family NSS transporter small subunit [Candidatus Thermoplasmatota archaeon]|nr:MetS family NSS transporter small subunit [Candidatus Thermoplasmatota archaeon]MBU1940223.1 MetS family NSS transporter small subunit [Candidatus Thermoplasmatota archaeon]